MRLNYEQLLYAYSIYVSENYYAEIVPVSGIYVKSFNSDSINNFLKYSKIDRLEKILQRPHYIKFLYKQLKGNNV